MLLGVLLLRLGADDATGYADPLRDYEIESVPLGVRPYDADFVPECLLIAALFRFADNICAV